jgi:hypothetical protein
MLLATSAKFCLHAGNIKFNAKYEELIDVFIIICIVPTIYYPNTICNKNVFIITGNIYNQR